MGQCRTLDVDETVRCYCADYSSCDNNIPKSFFIWNNFFSITFICLLLKVTASHCIACLIY